MCVVDPNAGAVVTRSSEMPTGFIRVKLLQCERGELATDTQTETFDPFVAVNVKEAQTTPGK